MIQTSRRPRGARSLVVITSAALSGIVVPLVGTAPEASADGPVRPRSRYHVVPTHRLARPPGLGRPGRFGRPGGHVHRVRNRQAETAKVSVDTSAPTAPILPGRVYHWPFVVKNRSAVRADGVTFAAPLPGGLQFVSAEQNCSFADGAAVCQLGALEAGESKKGVLNALVGPGTPGGRPIDGNALVTWHSTAAETKGRTTAVFPEVQVADTADVSVVKGGPAVVRPGQQVPYQLTVANHGPTAAKNVRLTSTSVPVLVQAAQACAVLAGPRRQGPGRLGGPRAQGPAAQGPAAQGPAAQGPAADAPVAQAAGAQGLVCDIGTLEPGETRAIKINAKAGGQLAPGTVIQAPSQVSTSTIDTDLSNNQADTRTRVEAAPVPRRAVPRSVPDTRPGAPNAGSGLPVTGAPTTELLHLVVVLLGTGLILYRIGRAPRRQR